MSKMSKEDSHESVVVPCMRHAAVSSNLKGKVNGKKKVSKHADVERPRPGWRERV